MNIYHLSTVTFKTKYIRREITKLRCELQDKDRKLAEKSKKEHSLKLRVYTVVGKWSAEGKKKANQRNNRRKKEKTKALKKAIQTE